MGVSATRAGTENHPHHTDRQWMTTHGNSIRRWQQQLGGCRCLCLCVSKCVKTPADAKNRQMMLGERVHERE